MKRKLKKRVDLQRKRSFTLEIGSKKRNGLTGSENCAMCGRNAKKVTTVVLKSPSGKIPVSALWAGGSGLPSACFASPKITLGEKSGKIRFVQELAHSISESARVMESSAAII
jgi:hypothetical protein